MAKKEKTPVTPSGAELAELQTGCGWARTPMMRDYHDTEWGVPVYDDLRHFEFLTLESAQAGLSWEIVLRKREGYRKAFANFDPEKVAAFTEADIERIVQDPGIIRNRLKVAAAVNNAKRFLEVQKEFGSFTKYIWGFVDFKPVVHALTINDEIPATSAESDALSRDLKKRGFKFVGSTIVYAHMQAAGLINDHRVECPRHAEVRKFVREI